MEAQPGQTPDQSAGQAPAPGKISDAGIKAVVDLLAALGRGDLAAVQTMTAGVRFSADSLRATIKRFGKTPTDPPADIASHFTVRPVPMTQDPTWSVGVPMWTKEEGRSEVEIRVRVVESGGAVKVMLDAVRVP